MKILELNEENFDWEAIVDLLHTYILEDFYLRSLKIDKDQFIEFKTNTIKNKINNGARIWQVVNDGNILALFGVQRNKSRSDNFGLNYFEYNPLYNFSPYANECLNLFERGVLLQEINDKGIDYIKVRVDASDYFNIAAFSDKSYQFIGTSLNLLLRAKDYKTPEYDSSKYKVEEYSLKHKNFVKHLIQQHEKNEDFYDIELEKKKTQDNFWNWFIKHNESENVTTLVLRDKESNSFVGFSCYSKEPSFSMIFKLNLITRDLTIIRSEYYGKGLANILFSEIMDREQKNVELKLLSNNYSAIRFNHFNGFKIVSSHHYFRKLIRTE